MRSIPINGFISIVSNAVRLPPCDLAHAPSTSILRKERKIPNLAKPLVLWRLVRNNICFTQGRRCERFQSRPSCQDRRHVEPRSRRRIDSTDTLLGATIRLPSVATKAIRTVSANNSIVTQSIICSQQTSLVTRRARVGPVLSPCDRPPSTSRRFKTRRTTCISRRVTPFPPVPWPSHHIRCRKNNTCNVYVRRYSLSTILRLCHSSSVGLGLRALYCPEAPARRSNAVGQGKARSGKEGKSASHGPPGRNDMSIACRR